GQPTAEQLAAIRDAGYKVVVNLAMPDSDDALPGEADLVRELGMSYKPIPVVWTEPTLDDLKAFFETMDRQQGNKVFVHCIKNYRVSAFVFLYRVIRLGVPLRTARKAMLDVWQPNHIWQRFVDEALAKYGMQA
ncbi:MAG: protein tyrosine phosphatase family protein, partial [Anaerolineae bacterium]|nr:protein tyrosine phosphatase family protein [Anaerolineae bacterium]